MRLYAGRSTDFIQDTTHNQIAERLRTAFFDHYRYHPSPNEVQSWQNSLRATAMVFQEASSRRDSLKKLIHEIHRWSLCHVAGNPWTEGGTPGSTAFRTARFAALALPILVSCAAPPGGIPEPGSREPAVSPTTAPAELLGTFEDDYGIRYTISSSSWRQGSGIEYHVVAWDPAGRSLIARNDDDNPSGGGQWTRIDWVRLEDMTPWTWAYCLTVYDAATRDAAESAPAADRASPRTGCNGFPFSRMRRVE